MTKHCKFPADQNWQCQKPSHRFLRFPITHGSTHKPHNSNAHILQITCFFLGLWNENKVSQTKILQDYIKYRQKYRPVPPLGLLVDPPMVSISKFHVTSFSGYHIYKIFRKPDLWRWPWGWVHWWGIYHFWADFMLNVSQQIYQWMGLTVLPLFFFMWNL